MRARWLSSARRESSSRPAQPCPPAQSRDLDEAITSVALAGRVHARVILPAGYDDHPLRRYPVVYFLHGLPAAARPPISGNDWLARRDRSKPGRRSSSSRRAPATATPIPSTSTGASAATGRRTSSHRAAALRRRPLPHDPLDARGRAIVGLSAGGYGATVDRAQPPGSLLGDRVVVGLLPPDRPDRDAAARPRPARGRTRLIGARSASLRSRPTFLAFYVGRGDSRFRDENVQFDRELTAAHVPHRLRALPRARTRRRSGSAHADSLARGSRSRHLARPP